MNLCNEDYEYCPDLWGNRELPAAERIQWVLTPPTLQEVQAQDSEDKRAEFYHRLLHEHVTAIRNMSIAGHAITSVLQMEELAAKHLSPRQVKCIGDELLRAVTEACFLSESEAKN